MDLSNLNCSKISKDMKAMSLAESQTMLRNMDNWEIMRADDYLYLHCLFFFSSFKFVSIFIQRVKKMLKEQKHYPNITFGKDYVIISSHTDELNGIHLNDFIIAKKTTDIFLNISNEYKQEIAIALEESLDSEIKRDKAKQDQTTPQKTSGTLDNAAPEPKTSDTEKDSNSNTEAATKETNANNANVLDDDEDDDEAALSNPNINKAKASNTADDSDDDDDEDDEEDSDDDDDDEDEDDEEDSDDDDDDEDEDDEEDSDDDDDDEDEDEDDEDEDDEEDSDDDDDDEDEDEDDEEDSDDDDDDEDEDDEEDSDDDDDDEDEDDEEAALSNPNINKAKAGDIVDEDGKNTKK